MIKSWLHLRYSLAFKDFTYQGRLTKLNFFHHASNWNFNLTLICSFQNGTPASLNTEAYTERRGRNRLRYSLTTSMSVTLLLIFLFKLRFPRRLMLSWWQSRDNWISLWGRSGVDHNLNGYRSPRHQADSPPANSPPRNDLATNVLATKERSRHQATFPRNQH